MEADLRSSQLLDDVLEMQVQRLEADEVSIGAGEDHVVLVLPAAAGTELHLVLPAFGLPEDSHRAGGQRDRALLAVLQGRVHHLALIRAGGNADKLSVDAQRMLLHVQTIPGQADQFAFPQAGEKVEAHHQIVLIILGQLHEAAHLLLGQRMHLHLLNVGQLAAIRHIPADHVHLDCLVEHAVEHTVHIADALG